jgi:hypothetical protein
MLIKKIKVMKLQIKSIFEQIASQVFTMTNLTEAQNFIIDFVRSKDIKQEDKDAIIVNTIQSKSITRLQTYICNSLLKYEGMSVNKDIVETAI